MATHRGDDGFGNFTAVEHLGPLCGDLLEGLCQLRVAQDCTHGQRPALFIQEVTGHCG
ncbi:hypothetical protein D3C71_2055770 [compost metagenome]